MSDPTGWRALPVGARVVVRRRLTPTEAADARAAGRGGVWTDVIAVVLDVDDDGLTLRTDAPREPEPRILHVPAGQVQTVKQIPPRPPRRAARHGGPSADTVSE